MENNQFNITKIDSNSILVITKNYLRTECWIKELNEIINSSYPETQNLILDLLLSNGKKDRFYKGIFKDGKTLLNSFVLNKPSDSIVNISDCYFSERPEIYERGLFNPIIMGPGPKYIHHHIPKGGIEIVKEPEQDSPIKWLENIYFEDVNRTTLCKKHKTICKTLQIRKNIFF